MGQTYEEWLAEANKIRQERQAALRQERLERKAEIRRLIIRFNEMFPDAPKGQGKFIAEDAYYRGKVVHDDTLTVTDKVFRMTYAFLRHQFYDKRHYGNPDARRSANRHAIAIMREWGFARKTSRFREKVACPVCMGQTCEFCGNKGQVPKWVAVNYEGRLRWQQKE